MSTAITSAAGTSSRSSSSRFGSSSPSNAVTPVRLPLGRLRLVTIPSLIGSPPIWKTMGIVVVAFLAARAAARLFAKITGTRRPTNSAASAGNRSYCSAQRNAMATLRPSTKPSSFKPRRNATKPSTLGGPPARRNPTTGIACCCALAACGHAVAAPPRRVMNSRRCMVSPPYSITASARPSSVSGKVRPSVLAVFMLMISSIFVDCCTGRSAGFSPLRMRPV